MNKYILGFKAFESKSSKCSVKKTGNGEWSVINQEGHAIFSSPSKGLALAKAHNHENDSEEVNVEVPEIFQDKYEITPEN